MSPILRVLYAVRSAGIAIAAIFALLTGVALTTAHASVSGVLPDYYSEPGSNPFRDVSEMTPNEAIDPFTGGLQLRHLDVFIPGNGGLDIHIARVYNSNNVYKSRASELEWSTAPKLVHLLPRSPVGLGWTLHFGRVTRSVYEPSPCARGGAIDTTDNPVLERADGSQQILFSNDTAFSALFITRDQWVAYCYGTNQGLLVISPEGVKYTMNYRRGGGSTYTGFEDISWYTTRIEDRNGNWINIAYDSTSQPYSPNALIQQITTSDGRVVDFSYLDATDSTQVRLDRITVGSRTWRYYYTAVTDYGSPGYYQLTKVELPGGTSGAVFSSPYTWLYAYWSKAVGDPGHRILQKVTYPLGATTSYDYAYACFNASPTVNYQCSQLYDTYYSLVVASKTLGGRDVTAGTWTYSYAPASTEDVTTVTFPGGKHVYKHFGSRFAYSADPTRGGSNLWKIGLLKEKLTYDGTSLVNQEIYTWDAPYKLSNEEYVRPPFTGSDTVHLRYYDTYVYMPLLLKKEIIRDGTSYTTTYSNFKTGDASFSPQTVTETGQGTRTWNYTYFPRTTGQNIVNLLEDETLASPAMTENANTLRTFDSTGNLRRLVRHGVAEDYSYYQSGDLYSRTNARNFQWIYSAYRGGIPQTETHPEGVTVRRTVNEFGEITSVTNGRNYVTNYTYDGLSRITSIDPPAGDTVTVSWSATGRTVTRGSYQQVTTLDGLGRPSYVDTNGVTQDINYNALGHKTFESYYSSTSGDFFTPDVLGRVKSVQHGDGTGRAYSYLAGNRVSQTNERGFATTATYRTYGDPDNGADRVLMREDAPESISTVFVRDPFGNPRSASQGSVVREYGYNTNLFLVSESHPETGVTAFGRDAVGNMTSRKVGASATTTYVYDGLDRLKSIDYPGNTPDVTFGYDGNDNLTSVGTATASRTLHYDANDNRDSETLIANGLSFTAGYGYNARDQLASLTYPSSRVINYAPDALGRPTAVTPYASSVAHHPNGVPKDVVLANGQASATTLTRRQWLEHVSVQKSGVTTAADLTYVYDGLGNVQSITNALSSADSKSMTYDGVDRLRTAGPASLTYDPVGNITSYATAYTTLSYGYDFNNRLASVGGSRTLTFSYDAYGNISGNGTHTFVYDDAGNLRTVGGASTAQYDYDGKNLRVRAQDASGDRYFFYALDGRLLGEYDNTGAWKKEYVYLGAKLLAQVENVVAVAPGVPAGITVPATSTGNHTVSWLAAGGTVTHYELQQDTSATFAAPSLVYSGSALSAALTVTQDGSYYYRVRACNLTECSGYLTGANGVAVTIPPLPPGTPSGITVPASNTTGSYTVSWGAASGVVTRYELQESTSSTFATATLKYSGTALAYAVSGKASGTYYYRVRACNSSGCSNYVAGANGVVVTLPTAPGVPASITVPSRVNPATAFTVSWGASSGTVSYYELQDGYTTSLYVMPTTWGTIYTGLNRSLTIAGKAAGTKVAYRVRACNSVGCSGYRTSTIVNINKLFGANDRVLVGLNEWAE